jgi:hypothetical protein
MPSVLLRSVCALVLISSLAGCSLLGSDGDSGTFEGFVSWGFEVSAFSPCDREETWWVDGGEAEAELFERYFEIIEQASGEPAGVYARVRGEVTERGEYGHLGAYEREVDIEEVLEVRAAEGRACE